MTINTERRPNDSDLASEGCGWILCESGGSDGDHRYWCGYKFDNNYCGYHVTLIKMAMCKLMIYFRLRTSLSNLKTYMLNYSTEQYNKITTIVFWLSPNGFSPLHSKKVIHTHDNVYFDLLRGILHVVPTWAFKHNPIYHINNKNLHWET